MVSDAQRRDLFEVLVRNLGEGAAETMMDLLPPVGWADVARRSDLELLRGEISVRGSELRGEMSELRGEMSELRGEMASIRSALDAQFSKLVVANLATSAAFAALVFGAVRVAASM